MNRTSRWLLMFFSLTDVACISVPITSGTNFSVEEIRLFNEHTKKQDILKKLGKPFSVQTLPTGYEVVTYSYCESASYKNRKGETKAVSFTFRGDQLREYRILLWDSENPAGAQPKTIVWSADPTDAVPSSKTAIMTPTNTVEAGPGGRTRELKGLVSSSPVGAKIFATSAQGPERPLGETPQQVNLYYKRFEDRIYLVFKLDGYLTRLLQLDTVSGNWDITCNFELLKDYSPEIASERESCSKDFLKRLADVAGVFEKAASAPQATAPMIDAKTELTKLVIDFPDRKTSAICNTLKNVLAELEQLAELTDHEPTLPISRYPAANVDSGIRAIRAVFEAEGAASAK